MQAAELKLPAPHPPTHAPCLACRGYGIRYRYGMFKQSIKDGFQLELPDYWLGLGNPYEIRRPEVRFKVGFFGGLDGNKWTPGEEVREGRGGEGLRCVGGGGVLGMACEFAGAWVVNQLCSCFWECASSRLLGRANIQQPNSLPAWRWLQCRGPAVPGLAM